MTERRRTDERDRLTGVPTTAALLRLIGAWIVNRQGAAADEDATANAGREWLGISVPAEGRMGS